MVKNLPAMHKTWVQFLGWKDLLEEGMAAHSSILASFCLILKVNLFFFFFEESVRKRDIIFLYSNRGRWFKELRFLSSKLHFFKTFINIMSLKTNLVLKFYLFLVFLRYN